MMPGQTPTSELKPCLIFNSIDFSGQQKRSYRVGRAIKLGCAYGAVSSEEPSDGSVTITFAPEGRDKSPLTADEHQLVQWLLDHDTELKSALLAGLLAEYPKQQELYGYEGSERAEYMPDVLSADDFRKLIGLYGVNLHPLQKDGLPYLGFEFGCTWDVEHGLGVLMHGTRVVEVGGADTAILLWIAERDAGVDQ